MVIGFVGNNGAVLGRAPTVELVFPFDGAGGLMRDCFTREGATRDIAPIIGAEAYNNTQTYTRMCLVKNRKWKKGNLY